jgi:hypothetical protein
MRIAGALLVLLTSQGLTACQSGSECPRSCPSENLLTTVVDVTASSGLPDSGVQATMTGPVTGSFSCQSGACFWMGPSLTGGSYTLKVSSTGYQATAQQERVTISQACGCTSASIEPPTEMLTPRDGGSD